MGFLTITTPSINSTEGAFLDMNVYTNIIFPAIDEINETLTEEEHLKKNPNMPLFGDGSTLDSIGLVNLIVTTERIVEELTGKMITLATETAFSRKQSPFRTVESLAQYIEELLKNCE